MAKNKRAYKVNRERVSEITRAMYDVLSDGKVHSSEDVLREGFKAALGTDYSRCIAEGHRARHHREATTAEYAHSGARALARNNLMIAKRNGRIKVTSSTKKYDRIKLDKDFATEWRIEKRNSERIKPKDPIATQPFGKVAFYGGMSEWEGWAYAPLYTRDVAHVRPTVSVPYEKLVNAFPGWQVSEAPDGLVTISAPPGSPVKEVVSDWFNKNDIFHDGVRDAKGIKRRDLNELPSQFLYDLMDKSVVFARGLVSSRHGASMQRLVGDLDDIEGYVALWVIELASSFDASLGRPFGTWLTNQLPRKVQDLNRAAFGRTASDVEIKHARAKAKFEAEHGRSPTYEELRLELGLSKSEMHAKRRHLSTLTNLRSATSVETDADEPEIVVRDEKPNPEEVALQREKSRQITLALLGASGIDKINDAKPVVQYPLGFLATYLMTWDDWVKGDLIYLAGCADRKVTDEIEKVQADLARRLTDMRNR
jgi:hypothetical protein